MHWSICLLHFNELPLRKLFVHIDGVTTGPKLFSGPIGKMLVSCEQRPIKEFQKVFSDDLIVLPENVVKQLSNDQRYLYDICHCIQNGKVDASLAMRNPGTMVHSRFLTTANRILRYYVSIEYASAKLKSLVNFIIKVYAPMWFDIKCNESFLMGPKLMFNYIRLVRQNVQNDLKCLIYESIQRNSYFAHAENVILSMLCDNNKDVREMAVNSILEARKAASKRIEATINIRKFEKPKINFNAKVYYEITNISFTDPPLTQKTSENVLRSCIENEDNYVKNLAETIPSHTQSVERYVQLVSQVSSSVVGETNRSNKITSTITSRSILPSANSKKDYINYVNH